uniref:NTR domain-containing protein n=1 Tax=Elaeophora elaphi TaxID=1147741 RepID=A0A0R3RST3_9BILA
MKNRDRRTYGQQWTRKQFCAPLFHLVFDGKAPLHDIFFILFLKRFFSVRQIEGGWRDWSAWSVCSVSCGHGLQRRWRLCDSPAPQNGGTFCRGNFVESADCDAGDCTESPAAYIPISDTACSCGCLLIYSAGRFFARTCEEITDWTLKSHGRFLHLKLKHDSTGNQFRLAIYRDLKKQELIYDSGINNHILKSNLQFIPGDYCVISLLKVNSSLNINSGVEVNFEWRNDAKCPCLFSSRFILESDQLILPSITTLKLSHACMFCHHNLSLLLSSLFIILILSLPPLLCSYVTLLVIRKAKWKQNRQLRIGSSLEQPRHANYPAVSTFPPPLIWPNLSMIQSGQTDTTEVRSNRTVITKRSIGIQLSASSTPRFPRDKGMLWSRATNSPQMTPRFDEHSSLSFSTEHDLEYDYYEPAVPGSFLTPAINFFSDIDIEQIIDSSELSYSLISKHDAHTQVDDDV